LLIIRVVEIDDGERLAVVVHTLLTKVLSDDIVGQDS